MSEKYQGQGLSYELINTMKIFTEHNKIEHIVLPVWLTSIRGYSLIPLQEYIKWQKRNG